MRDEELYRLIEQWEALADEAQEQTRLVSASDLSRVSFYQGVMNTYRRAAQDLRALFVDEDATPAEPPQYLSVPESEAEALLRGAGLFTRSLTLHSDRVFSAVFSRLQPITLENRIRLLTEADPRLVVLDSGTLIDSGDPYIDFAFVKIAPL